MAVGGKIFIATTLGVAAMNGALLPLLGAAGLGYLAYKSMGKVMAGPADSIYAKTERDMRARVEKITDKEVRTREEKQLKRDLQELDALREKDDTGRGEAAKWLGIGVFAFPAAGLVALAALGVERLWAAQKV